MIFQFIVNLFEIKSLINRFYMPTFDWPYYVNNLGEQAGGVQNSVRTLILKVLMRSKSDLLTIFMALMPWPGLITSKIAPGTLGLWPLIHQRLVKYT